MAQRERILLIRLKSIGDILFTLPAVDQVRAGRPEAHIAFLVSKEHAPLIRGFAGVDEVLTVDRKALRRGNPCTILREVGRLLRELGAGKVNLVIDFQGYGETALLSRWTRAARRIGAVNGGARGWAYTRRVPRQEKVHPADFNLHLVWESGLPKLPVRNEFILPPEAIQRAEGLLLEARLDPSTPLLCIQPFTSTAEKNWPLEGYLQLAKQWQARKIQTCFLCSQSETVALDPARQAGFPVFAGEPLLTAGGLMKASALVVGGDTGLLHLAVALGKRVVMLMNWAGPGNSYPFGHQDWALVPQPGRGLETLTLEQVEASCAAALEPLVRRAL